MSYKSENNADNQRLHNLLVVVLEMHWSQRVYETGCLVECFRVVLNSIKWSLIPIIADGIDVVKGRFAGYKKSSDEVDEAEGGAD
jgi:hypothetical protein